MWIGLLWTVVGVGVAVVGWLSSRGRLPLGHWAGIRTPATLASVDAWDAGNREGGSWLLGGGALTTLVGILVLVARPSGDTAAVLSIVLAFSLIVTVTGGVVIGVGAAREVNRQREGLDRGMA